jgi:glucose-1-phosphate thymidylyltransferase
MKGLVLAGGTGSRLHPLTLVTNKHLLPVYDQPMIHYPLRTLAGMGITDVMVILGGRSIGDIVELLGDGSAFGLTLTYRYQARPMGIAHAIGLARDFVGIDSVCVVLGDNILLGPDLRSFADAFAAGDYGAGSLLYQVPDPERFGVAVFDANGRITGFLEKPLVPPSDLIPIGVYLLAPDAFEVIDRLVPSGRGELEITDVLTHYARQDALLTQQYGGSWSDAGTIESLLTSSTHVSAYDPATTRVHEAEPPRVEEPRSERIGR